MDAQKLKGLQVREKKLQQELADIRKSIQDLTNQLHDRQKVYEQILREMRDISEHRPAVTEHAMLRYVERILNINLADIEKDILSEETLKVIAQLPSSKIPFKDNFVLVVKNKTVITISERDR